jgi:hypothetical protein
MSLPTIEPLPDENASLPSGRRRRRRMVIPPGASERGKFVHDLSLRTVPTFDFYLFSLLAGLVLVAALLLDSPPLFVLGALVAPFMAPAVGIALGTIAGAVSFVIQSLGSLLIGSLIVFLCGLGAGWAASFLPERAYTQAALHAQFTWPDFLVLSLGAGMAAFLLLRAPNQKPLAASVAIAYELYLPACVAGFGLSSGISGLWPGALVLFFIHLVWASLAGTLVLAFRGLRPLRTTGYLLGILYAGIGAAALAMMFSPPPALPEALAPRPSAELADQFVLRQPSATPSLTATLIPSQTQAPPTVTITPTRTLLPSRTATLTLSPVPTPVWARINASEGGGALIRKEPNYNAPVLSSVLNGTLVEVLPEVKEIGGVAWVHIRLVDGRSGWVVRGLLRTATPAPNW